MADNFTANSVTFRSDDVSSVHYQVVKMDVGGDGATIPVTGDSTLAGIPVVSRHKRVRVSVTPTVSSGAIYAAKDAVGGEMTFASAVRASGGSGRVTGVTIVDKGQQMAALDLVLFSATVTAADNAIFAPSDAELATCVGLVEIAATTDWNDFSTNSVCHKSVDIPFLPAATSLFGVLVTRGTPTYTSTSDLVVSLDITQD